MKSELIPIYAKSDGKLGYTIFVDLTSKKAFKGYHQEYSQAKWWFGYFGLLFTMRALAEITLPDTWIVKALFIGLGIPISIFIGKILQKKLIDYLTDIYLSEYMLDDYIQQGKKLMVREFVFAIVIFVIAIVLCILFLIHNWLGCIVFSFLSFTILGMLMNNLTIRRWKIYRNGL